MKCLSFLLITVSITLNCLAQEIPQKISYQGKLLESGIPVTGTKSITFTIDSWTETHDAVEITDGLYSAILGSVNPIPPSLFDENSTLVLQISVDGTNLTPTTEILSSPYAFKAEKAVDAEKIAGNQVSVASPTNNQVLKWNGSSWTPQNDGLTLPYSKIYNGNSDAFQISNTTTGSLARFNTSSGNTLHLEVGGSSLGTSDVFHIFNYGTQDAIYIENGENASQAITIQNLGNHEAIKIYNDGNDNAFSVSQFGSGNAGYFDGDVEITGTLIGGKSYSKIDDPLDPENKYLYHSTVESSDMMNIYNGIVILDDADEATIKLPDWFEALNMEFRYQLTCIGGYANVYVAEEINNNSFKIAGGKPGLKVSWQVTGIRHDPFANQNRIPIEVEKTAKEKGHYLHYKAYDLPFEKSIEAIKNPEMPDN